MLYEIIGRQNIPLRNRLEVGNFFFQIFVNFLFDFIGTILVVQIYFTHGDIFFLNWWLDSDKLLFFFLFIIYNEVHV